MAKPQSDKEWQERNPEKARKYVQKYLEDKERVTLTSYLAPVWINP